MRKLVALLLVLGLTPLAIGQETIDNPSYTNWSKHKVGTSVTTKMVSDAAGQKSEMTMTYKLLEIKPEKCVVEVTTKTKVAGMEFDAPPQKTDIEKTFKIPTGQKKEDVEKGKPEGTTSEGEETIKIGGKEYKTKWYKYSLKKDGMETDAQTWTSNDVPNMTVKMVMTVKGKDANMSSTMTMEVTEIKVP